MQNTLKDALGNRTSTHTFKGKTYQLEEWDLNDIADVEEQLGDLSALNPTKTAHQRLILYIALRRSDEMLTPPELRACKWRVTQEDIGHLFKASDLRRMETLAFVAAILKASGLYGEGSDEKKESAQEQDQKPTGETSSPS